MNQRERESKRATAEHCIAWNTMRAKQMAQHNDMEYILFNSISLFLSRSLAQSLARCSYDYSVFSITYLCGIILKTIQSVHMRSVCVGVCSVYVCIEYDKGISCEWTMHVKYAWELNQFFGGNGAFCARRARSAHNEHVIIIKNTAAGGA